MSITEHIQEVAGRIVEQRAQAYNLKKERSATMVAFMAAMALMAFSATQCELASMAFITSAVFALFLTHRYERLKKTLFLTRQLLSQNEVYRNIIIEETFSGRDFDSETGQA